MTIGELADSLTDLKGWSHADKIRLFAWFLHTQENKESFQEADIRRLYNELGIAQSSNLTSQLKALVNGRSRDLLQNGSGYKLERSVRLRLAGKHAPRERAVLVTDLLKKLPNRISNPAGQQYLEEALICFRYGAYRAAIVMSWNLSYDHLCQFVLVHRLAVFNAQLPKSFPKADISAIATRDDFSELKESQVLQVLRSANIISGSVHKILKEKLDRRNIVAHPSGVQVGAPTAEEYILDLVSNTVMNPGLAI